MDLSYESFKQGKLKPIKSKNDLSYSAFLEKKQKIAQINTERQTRISQGQPVSIFKSRAEPSLVENLVSGIARPFEDIATNAINAGQVAVGAKVTKPLSNKYQGEIKGLGEIDITKGPWDKDNLKTIIKSASTGAEIASYLNAAGVAEKTVAGLTAKGVLANKATFAEWAVKNIPALAKEGALQGIAYTAGSQGREYADTGKPFSAEQAAKDIALSTAGNVIIPTALRKVFSGDAKINAARVAERDAKNAAVLDRPIPPVGTKFDNLAQPTAGKITDNVFNPAEKTTPEISFDLKTKQPKTKVAPTETIKNTIEITPQTIERDTSSLVNDLPEGLDYSTFKDWSTQVRSLPKDEIIRVAMGGRKTIPNTVPEGAYLSIAKNIAKETEDIKLAQKLADSNVISKDAQGLVASKMAQHGNVTDILRDIKTTFLKKKGITPEKFIAEQSSYLRNIKQKFKEIDDAIINNLICK